MTIIGTPKIFDLSKALIKNGDTVTVSSGATSKDNILDFDKFTRWESVGSDDLTTETITVTFSEPRTFDRILLTRHNFKSYSIAPATGSFTNVIGLFSQTPGLGISETDYGIGDSYYEFDSISTTGIVSTVTLAQTVDAQKYIFNLIPTSELGTFQTYPVIASNDFQALVSKTMNRRAVVNKLNPVFSASLSIELGNNQNDVDLMTLLADRNDDFILWANGGQLTENESASPFYRFSFKPYRLGDFYKCQVVSSKLPEFINNIYVNAFIANLQLIETA